MGLIPQVLAGGGGRGCSAGTAGCPDRAPADRPLPYSIRAGELLLPVRLVKASLRSLHTQTRPAQPPCGHGLPALPLRPQTPLCGPCKHCHHCSGVSGAEGSQAAGGEAACESLFYCLTLLKKEKRRINPVTVSGLGSGSCFVPTLSRAGRARSRFLHHHHGLQ